MDINKQVKSILDKLEYNNLFKETDALQEKLANAIMNRYSSNQIENILIDFVIDNKLNNNKNIKIAYNPLKTRGVLQPSVKPNNIKPKSEFKLPETSNTNIKRFLEAPQSKNFNTSKNPPKGLKEKLEENNLTKIHEQVEGEVKKGISRKKALIALGVPLALATAYSVFINSNYPGLPDDKPVPDGNVAETQKVVPNPFLDLNITPFDPYKTYLPEVTILPTDENNINDYMNAKPNTSFMGY